MSGKETKVEMNNMTNYYEFRLREINEHLSVLRNRKEEFQDTINELTRERDRILRELRYKD